MPDEGQRPRIPSLDSPPPGRRIRYCEEGGRVTIEVAPRSTIASWGTLAGWATLLALGCFVFAYGGFALLVMEHEAWGVLAIATGIVCGWLALSHPLPEPTRLLVALRQGQLRFSVHKCRVSRRGHSDEKLLDDQTWPVDRIADIKAHGPRLVLVSRRGGRIVMRVDVGGTEAAWIAAALRCKLGLASEPGPADLSLGAPNSAADTESSPTIFEMASNRRGQSEVPVLPYSTQTPVGRVVCEQIPGGVRITLPAPGIRIADSRQALLPLVYFMVSGVGFSALLGTGSADAATLTLLFGSIGLVFALHLMHIVTRQTIIELDERMMQVTSRSLLLRRRRRWRRSDVRSLFVDIHTDLRHHGEEHVTYQLAFDDAQGHHVCVAVSHDEQVLHSLAALLRPAIGVTELA